MIIAGGAAPQWAQQLVTDLNAFFSRLGTASTKNVGTAAGNVVQLDAAGKLPAVDGSQLTGFGTAASKNVGTAPNNVVQLDGSSKLPAVDGSNLTGLPPGSGAVRYDAAQTLTAGQQTQALANVSAVSFASQTLTSAQQLQARSNLGMSWRPIVVVDFTSATAAVDVVLPTGLKVIRLTGWIDSDASNGAPMMRTSADAGVTFAAGATDYQYSGFFNSAGTVSTVAPTNANGLFLAGGDSQSNIPAMFTTVLSLGDATRLPWMKTEWASYFSATGHADGQFAAFRGVAATVNAIRLLENVGNMNAAHVLIEGF